MCVIRLVDSTRRWCFVAALTVTVILSTGCATTGSHGTVQKRPNASKPRTALPASRTLLGTVVTLKSVKRTAAGAVEVRLVVRKVAEDNLLPINLGGIPVVSPNAERLDGGHIIGLADGSCVVVSYYRVPSSVRRVTISENVVSNEGALFRFTKLGKAHLPVTKHVGACYVTVQDVHAERPGPKKTAVRVDVRTNPGFDLSGVVLSDGRERLNPCKTATTIDRPQLTSFWFAAVQHRAPLTLGVTSSNDHAAQVKFEGVSIAPHVPTPAE